MTRCHICGADARLECDNCDRPTCEQHGAQGEMRGVGETWQCAYCRGWTPEELDDDQEYAYEVQEQDRDELERAIDPRK